MKKWIIYALIGMFLFTGCQDSTNEEVYYKLHKKLKNIHSYSCVAYIKAYGNKSSKEYVLKHYYKSPDYYKLEVIKPSNIKGKVTIYEGDKIIINNPNIKESYKLTYSGKENKYLFVGDFLKNIIENEKLEVSSKDNFLILKTTLPGTSIYFNKEKLYVDKKTFKPIKLEIIDANDKNIFTVIYKNFKYNGE